MASSEKSQPFLARLGSRPQDPQEAHELLQQRIAAWLAVTGSLYSLVWIANTLVNAIFYPGFAPGHPTSLRSAVHGVAALGLLLAWPWFRARRLRSLFLLRIADAASCVLIGLALGGVVALGHAVNRPDMVAVMVLTQSLALRASLIPSTAKRTLMIGMASSLPLLLGTWLLHAGAERTPNPASAWGVVATASLWLAMTVAITGVISFFMYGLQERVRAALKLGQYTLEEKLGEGGMGVVYRARHALLRRPTAIKLLLSGSENQGAVSRFAREVQITAGLSHPNIVAVYDFGQATDGRFYYVMEYLDGIDLEQVLRYDGPQHPGRVKRILTQAADALAEAHGAGLIHRDIKPANMILCQRSRRTDMIKLVDFGLVKETGNTDTTLSAVVSVKGTPWYLSPESIAAPDRIDARSDLYALGAVAYFLLTGRVVFEGPNVFEICAGHLHKQPVPPSQVTDKPIPPSLEAIILQCLAKAPADRPQTALEVLKALRASNDTPPWSPEDSACWWQERAPAIRAHMKRRDPSSDTTALTVEPGGR